MTKRSVVVLLLTVAAGGWTSQWSQAAPLRFPVGNPSDGSPYQKSQEFQDAPFAFEGKSYSGHLGEDWDLGLELGTDVFPIGQGQVVFSHNAGGAWGNVVIMRHGPLRPGVCVYSMYAHLYSRNLAEGAYVSNTAERVGTSGTAGSGPHLHFEIKDYRTNDISPGPGYTQEQAVSGDSLVFKGITYFRPTTFIQTTPGPSAPLTLDDSFGDNCLDPAKWQFFIVPAGLGTVDERNQRLEVSLNAGAANVGVTSRCSVGGDFNVQVDFKLATDGILSWPTNNHQVVKLAAADLGAGTGGSFGVERFSGNVESYHVVAQSTTVGFFPTTDLGGKLRLVRSGSTLTGFFHNGSTFTEVGSVLNLPASPTRFVLNVGSNSPSGGAVKIAFDNFTVNSGAVSCP